MNAHSTTEAHTNKRGGLTAIVDEPGVPVAAKIREWAGRYGLAECAGVACALIATFVARRLTPNPVVAAYAGAWGETIGYAAVIVGRDAFTEARVSRTARELSVDLVAEFGPSGVLDTMVIRPLAMGIGEHLFGATRGLVAGKLAADLVFYVPVIFMYEQRKRARRRQVLGD